MDVVWRLTIHAGPRGIDMVGLGKWVEGEPVGIKAMPVGPFDLEWEPVTDQIERALDTQLALW